MTAEWLFFFCFRLDDQPSMISEIERFFLVESSTSDGELRHLMALLTSLMSSGVEASWWFLRMQFLFNASRNIRMTSLAPLRLRMLPNSDVFNHKSTKKMAQNLFRAFFDRRRNINESISKCRNCSSTVNPFGPSFSRMRCIRRWDALRSQGNTRSLQFPTSWKLMRQNRNNLLIFGVFVGIININNIYYGSLLLITLLRSVFNFAWSPGRCAIHFWWHTVQIALRRCGLDHLGFSFLLWWHSCWLRPAQHCDLSPKLWPTVTCNVADIARLSGSLALSLLRAFITFTIEVFRTGNPFTGEKWRSCWKSFKIRQSMVQKS